MKWNYTIKTTGICSIFFTVAILLTFFTPPRTTDSYWLVFWILGMGTIFGATWSNKK